MRAAIAAALVCAAGAAAAGAAGNADTQQVRYGGYEIDVPASWPVYDLGEDPSTCVRFDRHAVYLGHPSAEQRCPAHAVGRSEAILVEPEGAPTGADSPRTLRAWKNGAAPRRLPMASPSSEVRVEVPSAGVTVTATWRRHPGLIRRIVGGASVVAGAEAPPAARRAAQARPVRAPAKRGTYHQGLGFDACAAPSKSAMSAWSASPYSAVGIYIGGVNRGCSQPNLTSRWVRREIREGWALMPIYVGLQAPGTSCNCATIGRTQARSQGRAAARDAMSDAQAVGLGPGNPIYFDMEYYTRTTTNSRTALRFMAAWTDELHEGNYVSGVYSSASAGIRDLVNKYRSDYEVPDDIWIANWDGRRTTDDPYVPDSYWSNHQRIRQYRGSHTETYRGVSINIDNNYLDGAVAGAADRDGDGEPDEFDLCARVSGPIDNFGCPYPSHVSGGLVNYVNSVAGKRQGDHYTTTAGIGPAYRFQGNLGFLLTQRLAGTVALYSCNAGRDQFLSRAADCGGAGVLGLVGFAYLQRPAGLPSRAIYRCRLSSSGELTASNEPDCGDPASTNRSRLGFTISVATLGRYVNSVEGHRRQGDHFTTTGGVGPAYRFQANLGFLLTARLPGTVPLYSCDVNRDQFLSRAADCAGAGVRGSVGFAYLRRPAGLPSRAIYRCRLSSSGELTVSYEPDCGDPASTSRGRLGFTISVATLGRYVNSVEGHRRQGDHFTTTGGVGRAYKFQGNLGFLLTQRLAGTVPLYSCRARGDQFLSRDGRCEGARQRGLIGWAYSKPPARTPSTAIYRCRRKKGERFVAVKPTCRRTSNVNEGRLGYVMKTPLPHRGG